MIVCDTSVAVAAFARWHADHQVAVRAIGQVTAVVDHVALETFSVLTRLPPPRRVPPTLVTSFLDHHFPGLPRLPGAPSSEVLAAARRADITGGAVYDLVVALAAARGGARLLSLDRRAAPTYAAADVEYRLLT